MYDIKEKVKSYTKEEKSAFMLGGIFVHADTAKEKGMFADMSTEEVMVGIIESASDHVKELLEWDDSK